MDVCVLDHKVSSIVKYLNNLSKYEEATNASLGRKKKDPLVWQKTEIVRHRGTSSRQGHVGVRLFSLENFGSSVIVWFAKINVTHKEKMFKALDQALVCEYSEDWEFESIRSFSVPFDEDQLQGHLLVLVKGIIQALKDQHDLRYQALFQERGSVCIPETTEEDTDLEVSQDIYIVWGPNGVRNPEKTHSRKEALAVIRQMAQKYKQTFYMAKLEAKAHPVTSIQVDVL